MGNSKYIEALKEALGAVLAFVVIIGLVFGGFLGMLLSSFVLFGDSGGLAVLLGFIVICVVVLAVITFLAIMSEERI